MLKIRNFVASVISIFMLMTTYQYVTARTEVVSNPSIPPAVEDSGTRGFTNQLEASGPSSTSTPEKCVYMPEVVRSMVACPDQNQVPTILSSDPGGFGNQVAMTGPSFPSKPVECIDMPGVVGSVVACTNPSQIPAPEWWIRVHSAINP
jgi:hypothetical protein